MNGAFKVKEVTPFLSIDDFNLFYLQNITNPFMLKIIDKLEETTDESKYIEDVPEYHPKES